tara:strand:+ start:2233 stop:2493 length:261 start_codon:yes stop_codon:yes gene_type:complete
MRKAKDWDLMLSYIDEDGARQYDVIEPDIDKIIKQFARNQNKKGWLELSDSEKKKESGYTYDQLKTGLLILRSILTHINVVKKGGY